MPRVWGGHSVPFQDRIATPVPLAARAMRGCGFEAVAENTWRGLYVSARTSLALALSVLVLIGRRRQTCARASIWAWRLVV